MNILITGATSGIGFLSGISLATRGHNVFMTTHTDKQLKTLNNKLKKFNLNVNTFKFDIIDPKDLLKLNDIDIDVLINHAGIGIGGSILDLDINKVKENFDVNFFASYNIVKLICKKFIDNGKNGKIIITSSIAGIIPIEFLGSYCSSKSAITMMAKCLKKELKMINSNIDIVLIEPGAYYTGFNQKMIDSVELSITKNSLFYKIKNKIHKNLTNKFKIIEKKKLDSIIIKIVKAVECDNTNFVYRAPLLQSVFSKIYKIFSK